MVYNDYIKKLATKIDAKLHEIEAIYNFDLGDEYEIALCHLLSDILPVKYGVCRGFIVDAKNNIAGDDLLIYDSLRHPTLRSSIGKNFHLKDQVPVEAVYAYIECKHTLSKDSLTKAIEQVKSVKSVMLKRQLIKNIDYDKQFIGKHKDWPHAYPKHKNQPFSIIFSRYLDETMTDNELNEQNITGTDTTPDLVVAGRDIILTPTVILGPDGFKSSLFYNEEDGIPLLAEKTPGLAYALGVMILIQALSWIDLNFMNLDAVINEAFWKSKF